MPHFSVSSATNLAACAADFTMGSAPGDGIHSCLQELLGVKRIVPCHYGTFGLLTGTRDEFEKLAPSGFTIEKLEPGESVTV